METVAIISTKNSGPVTLWLPPVPSDADSASVCLRIVQLGQ